MPPHNPLEHYKALKNAFENPAIKAMEAIYNNPAIKKIADSFNHPAIKAASEFSSRLQKLESNIYTQTQIVSAVKQLQTIQYTSTPFSDFISKIARSSFCNFLDSPPALPVPRVTEKHIQMMKICKWFPCIGWAEDPFLAIDILFAFRSETRISSKAKQRIIKKVDKIVFDYFNKTKLEALRKAWRKQELPRHITKVLNQCVKAYHKSEYILCVCTIMTLWEGLICQKSGLSGWHNWKKIQKGLSTLIVNQELSATIQSYCEDYIFYDCKGEDGYKSDVPGRHTYAHSWYTKYPSKKVALNAILFTDFLLNLNPITE